MSPSATAIEIEKNGMPRFAFSEPSIGSTTTVNRPSPRTPTSSLTSVTSSPRKRSRITRSAAASIAVVSSPPSPCADDRLALGAARQLGEHARDVVPRGAAELEPVAQPPTSAVIGAKSRPEVSFG